MKSLKLKFVLMGFCMWFTVFAAFALTPGTAFEQTLDEEQLDLGLGKRNRYYYNYKDLSDHKITVEAESDTTIYYLLINYGHWAESNQAWYNYEQNYLTGEGRAYTLERIQDTSFSLSWTETGDESRYIIFQNEGNSSTPLHVTITKEDLSTFAKYFGIGSVVILAGIFGWVFISRKKYRIEEPAPVPEE